MKLWPRSVRWRLTLWYSMALAVMLAAFSGGSFYILQRVLANRTDHFLEQARDAFITELQVEQSEIPNTVDATRAAMRDVRFRDIHFLVFDTSLRLIAASNDSIDALAVVRAPDEPLPLDRDALAQRLVTENLTAPAFFTIPDSEGGHRIAFRAIQLAGQPYIVAASQSRHPVLETLELVALAYLVAIPLFLVLAGVGGYVLATRALSPVAAMSRRAREISATTLHERLPVKNPHDELGELAGLVNELLERLESSFDNQRRFVADASHELRTPVAIVRAESEIALGRDSRPESEYRDALKVVQDAGHRLSRIVDDLFLLARADSGRQPLRKEPLYLDELINEVARAMRGLATQRSVRIDLAPMRESPYYGDPELLARMLLNLFDNAVKYSPESSVVRIALTNGAGGYRMMIADSGPGIPLDAQSRIFERFFRVEKARSRTESATTSGAGLGLAIARWIATAHEGALDLVRSTSTGSEFRVTLPLSSES